MVAASSRSEFVIGPLGLSCVARLRWMVGPNGIRQINGCDLVCNWGGGNMIPPMPWPLASDVPNISGGCATSSRRRVGRSCSELASHAKSCKLARMLADTLMRPLSKFRACSAACKWLKRPRAPDIAKDMDRNSPRILCHFWSDTRRLTWGYAVDDGMQLFYAVRG
jgi:hypothetical protein